MLTLDINDFNIARINKYLYKKIDRIKHAWLNNKLSKLYNLNKENLKNGKRKYLPMAFITFYVENVQNIYEFIAISKNLLNPNVIILLA